MPNKHDDLALYRFAASRTKAPANVRLRQPPRANGLAQVGVNLGRFEYGRSGPAERRRAVGWSLDETLSRTFEDRYDRWPRHLSGTYLGVPGTWFRLEHTWCLFLPDHDSATAYTAALRDTSVGSRKWLGLEWGL